MLVDEPQREWYCLYIMRSDMHTSVPWTVIWKATMQWLAWEDGFLGWVGLYNGISRVIWLIVNPLATLSVQCIQVLVRKFLVLLQCQYDRNNLQLDSMLIIDMVSLILL